MYINLLKKIFKLDSKNRSVVAKPFFLILINLVSNVFVPLFIIFKIRPNIITLCNFFVAGFALFFIFYANTHSLSYAFVFYIIYLILDCCDGGVARYLKIKTFFGKFMDSTFDIIFFVFFNLGISFIFFTVYNDKYIFLMGIISSILMSFNTFIFDKFSALVRWSNLENNKNSPPYIKKNKSYNFFLNIFDDIYYFGLMTFFYVSIFQKNELILLKIILYVVFSVKIFSSLLNLLGHFYFARKYLNISKK